MEEKIIIVCFCVFGEAAARRCEARDGLVEEDHVDGRGRQVGEWTCEACGRPVAQAEGVTTAAAVRAHARQAGHGQASVRRVTPSGAVHRWRTEAEREREREKAEERALRAEERRRWAELRTEGQGRRTNRIASPKRSALPVAPTPPHVWPALGGLCAVVLGFILLEVGGEAGRCARHSGSESNHMFAFESCSHALGNASAFEVFAGRVGGWVLLAGIMSLVIAVVLWVRHHIAPGDRMQFSIVVLLAVISTGRQLRRNARGSSSSAQRRRAPRGRGYGDGDVNDDGGYW